MKKNINIIDILLDEENDQNIILEDEGKEVIFEQYATIPYYDKYLDEDVIYVVLHPTKNSKNYNINNVYPFKVSKTNDGYTLDDVVDEEIINYLASKLEEE